MKTSSWHLLAIGALCLFWSSRGIAVAQQTPVTPPAIPDVGQNPQSPPAQVPQSLQKDDGKGTGQPGGPGAPVNSSSYKIGPADVLNIRVWNEPQFSGPVAVHQDGMITLALVGDLQAGGSTPVEVENKISTALAKYVVKPLVTVTVQEVGSKKYYMDGQINRPGEYALIVPTTILEAISKAGGIQPFANSKKIYVLRGDQRILFNYRDVLRGKHMDQNIQITSGDHIVVP